MTKLTEKMTNHFNNQNLANGTKNLYIKYTKSLIDNTEIKAFTDKTKDKVVNFIETRKSDSQKKDYYKPILNYLRDNKRKKKIYEFYVMKIKEIGKKIDDELKENKYKIKEKENKVEWKEIINIDMSKLNDEEKLLMSFIINDNLFLRLAVMTIKKRDYDEEKDNYVKGKVLHMNDFKNKNKLGSQKFTLSKKTLDLVKKMDNDEYLFSRGLSSKKVQSTFISRTFNKALGKKINNNLLRKIYINEMLKSNLSNKELEGKARRMLNTLNMWNSVYRKVD
jgi:hypothetical protein